MLHPVILSGDHARTLNHRVSRSNLGCGGRSCAQAAFRCRPRAAL